VTRCRDTMSLSRSLPRTRSAASLAGNTSSTGCRGTAISGDRRLTQQSDRTTPCDQRRSEVGIKFRQVGGVRSRSDAWKFTSFTMPDPSGRCELGSLKCWTH
jgi:hypothetical protein